MRASSPGQSREHPLYAVRLLAAIAVALSAAVLPAPPAVAAVPADVPELVALLAPPEPRDPAAERATRDFSRRPGRHFFTDAVRAVAAIPPAPVAVPVVKVKSRPAVKSAKPAKAGVKSVKQQTVEVAPVAVPESGRAAAVVSFVKSIVGRPYIYGAAGPSGYDCSGVIVAAYRRLGISLPHKASAFYGVGRAVPRSQLQPGDILIMSGGRHAGIYIGGGKMIHAPKPGRRVEIAPIWSFSAARRLV
jgi:peptidoglycan DL-endopeptidase CwlO